MLFVLMLLGGKAYADKPLLVYVGDVPIGTATPNADSGMIDLLNQVYGSSATIEYETTRYTHSNAALPQADIDHLNTAALVLVGPSMWNSAFVQSNASWNGLTTKLMYVSTGMAMRSSRLGWMNTTAYTQGVVGSSLTVPAANRGNAIFNGVTIAPDGTIASYAAGATTSLATINSGTNYAFTDASSSGIPLAWISATQPAVVKWTQSTSTPFYTGSTLFPTGERWFVGYLTATGATSEYTTDVVGQLSADGKQLLKNIITAALPVPGGSTPTPTPTPPATPAGYLTAPTSRIHFPDVNTIAFDTVTPSFTTVTLKNTGASALTFTRYGTETFQGLVLGGSTKISIDGVSAPTSAPLDPGASIIVTLRFNPPKGDPEGTFNNTTLTVYSNAANSPTTINLVGLSVPVGISRIKAE